MSYVIGIDLGTSSVKALLLSEEGSIIDVKTSSYSPDFGENGYVQQDPLVWWNHTKLVIKELMKANQEARDKVVSISCSGQMHSSVFFDKSNNIIRPAILWNDTRTSKQTKEIYSAMDGVQNVLREVYNLALEGFTLPKILWLRENEPDNYKRLCKVMMPKDYINFKLTGNIFTDYSDAAGTLMFDVKKREFNKVILNRLNISQDILPEAVESTAVVGNVNKEIAEELGLSYRTQVIAGGADNSCAAIGNGVVSKGQAVISVGTSGTVVAFLDDITVDVTGAVHLFNYSYPKSTYAMGCMLCAGEGLNWLKRNILTELSFEDLNKLVENTPIGANNLIFLPYLFGERCPYSDANARGMFFGLSSITGKGELGRAVMEGVAFGLRDLFGLVKDFTSMNEVYITGGGAKSEVWGQIIADVLNIELSLLNVEEGPAFGAALIAGVGANVFTSFEAAKQKTMKITKKISPSMENHEKYQKYYDIYRKLYVCNKELFEELCNG